LREYDFPLRQQLTTRQAAHYLGFDPATLRRWRAQGRGPSYIQYGRAIRYHQGVLDAWMATHVHKPGGSSGEASNDGTIVHLRERVMAGGQS
jgi:predicted DNA-binding transcriptional regulator AlpA